MPTKCEKSQKNLEYAMHRLQMLIDRVTQKTYVHDDNRLNHLESLNKELQIENTNLKEQLFAVIAQMNALKSTNREVYKNIDDVINTLEKATS